MNSAISQNQKHLIRLGLCGVLRIVNELIDDMLKVSGTVQLNEWQLLAVGLPDALDRVNAWIHGILVQWETVAYTHCWVLNSTETECGEHLV